MKANIYYHPFDRERISRIFKPTFCRALNLWRFDLHRKTCIFADSYCRSLKGKIEHCYADKLERAFPALLPKLKYNLNYWEYNFDIDEVVRWFGRKRSIRRFRWCSIGEIFYSPRSIDKVFAIAEELPSVSFWLTTRSLFRPAVRSYVFNKAMPRNLFITASISPGTIETFGESQLREVLALHGKQIKVSFFGNDVIDLLSRSLTYQLSDRDRYLCNYWVNARYRCPKTWPDIKTRRKRQGRNEIKCSNCRQGCFSTNDKYIWFKEH